MGVPDRPRQDQDHGLTRARLYQLLQDLLPYLVGFYILDGVVYVKMGQVLFAAPWGGAFALKKAGLHLVGLWPLSEHVTAWEAPVWYGLSGFYVTAARGGDAGFPRQTEVLCQRYDTVALPTVSGRNVEDGGRLLLEAATPAGAGEVARVLGALRAAGEAERPEVLRRLLLESMDVDGIRAQRRAQLRFAPQVKALAGVLFLGVFVLLPLSLSLSADAELPGAAALLLALAAVHVAILFLARRTLKLCGVGSTAPILLPMVFFPPAAIHVLSTIARDLYARFDPLAVAAALLDGPSFAQAVLRERSRLEVARQQAPADLSAYWLLRESLLAELVSRMGGDPNAMLVPPARTDAHAAAYCPLCFSEYRAGFGTCVDCEVALKAYPTASTPAAAPSPE